MKFKILAPVQTDFSIVSEIPIRQPKDYAAFWDGIVQGKQQLHAELPPALSLSPELAEIRFPHRHHVSRFNRYRSLDSDSLERTLHVIELQLDGSIFAANLTLAEDSMRATLVDSLGQLVCRVFDHGISLLEVDFNLDDWLQATPAEQIPAVLDDLQQAGIDLGEQLAHECANKLLLPLFNWLRSSSPDNKKFIEPSFASDEQIRNGAVLWVTRTLIFEQDDGADKEAIVRHWLKDSGGNEEENGKVLIDQIIDCEDQHLTRWLNYLFREGSYPAEVANPDEPSELVKPFCDEWEAMIYAQFFYAALDIVDLHLTRILAYALSQDHDPQISHLKSLLEHNIHKANLLLIQHHDNSKYYKRTVNAKLDEILDYWDFETVLVEPVQRKITLCQERLTLLHQEEVAKSAVYTDLILLGIGVTSIFGIFLSLAEYGRTMANDVDLASYDVNSTNIVDWFARQPTDVILVISSVLSLLLVVLYFYYRKVQAP